MEVWTQRRDVLPTSHWNFKNIRAACQTCLFTVVVCLPLGYPRLSTRKNKQTGHFNPNKESGGKGISCFLRWINVAQKFCIFPCSCNQEVRGRDPTPKFFASIYVTETRSQVFLLHKLRFLWINLALKMFNNWTRISLFLTQIVETSCPNLDLFLQLFFWSVKGLSMLNDIIGGFECGRPILQLLSVPCGLCICYGMLVSWQKDHV